jgi:hypothetical protein
MNENTGNYCSQSEAYDKHSLSNINDINSQINDTTLAIGKNAPNQLS